MMTSSNGNIFRVTVHLCGNSPVSGEFPTQRPVTQKFDVFFDLRLEGRLSKHSWGWWLETPAWSHSRLAHIIQRFAALSLGERHLHDQRLRACIQKTCTNWSNMSPCWMTNSSNISMSYLMYSYVPSERSIVVNHFWSKWLTTGRLH